MVSSKELNSAMLYFGKPEGNAGSKNKAYLIVCNKNLHP